MSNIGPYYPLSKLSGITKWFYLSLTDMTVGQLTFSHPTKQGGQLVARTTFLAKAIFIASSYPIRMAGFASGIYVSEELAIHPGRGPICRHEPS